MKLAIIGSRNANKIDIGSYIEERPDEIISGGAIGIDTMAANYAKKEDIKLTIIRPNYDKYGKCAPIIRNKEIVQLCDKIIAFWDGKSKGTQSCINFAKKYGKQIKVVML